MGTSMRMARSGLHMVRLIKLAARNLGWHGMIKTHRLDEPGVLKWVRRMLDVFGHKAPAHKTSHKQPAANIHPMQDEAVGMKNRHDVERQINEMHQPRPGAKGNHVGE